MNTSSNVNSEYKGNKAFAEAQKQYTNRIQKLCLPPDHYFPKELYFRSNDHATLNEMGSADPEMNGRDERAEISVAGGESVSFDTYFNMFPLFKWMQYTRIEDLCICVTAEGTGSIELCGIDRERPDEEFLIEQRKIQSIGNKIEFVIWEYERLSELPDFLFLRVNAANTEEISIYDAGFYTSAKRDADLNIACCFCTYKREAEIHQNVENLLKGIVHNPESLLSEDLQIYISDNGQTLPLDSFTAETSVHLFHNKNYGGSAGFTRCMIESCLRNEGRPFSHIILMDDDALIIPDAVERTGAFVSLLKKEYSKYMLGGALISKEMPYLQQENGVYINVDRWKLTKCATKVDLRNRREVIRHEMADETALNCNGWWFTCIPKTIVAEDNLPLPLFLHLDDGEYGYRNGGKFIRLNGIGVWHPNSAGLTKAKAYMGFYNSRNALIFQACYRSEKSRKEIFGYMTRAVSAAIFNYQYSLAQRSMDGFEMFYEGVDAFCAADAEKLNRDIIGVGGYEKCVLNPDERKALTKGRLQTMAPGSSRRQVKKLLNWIVPAWKGNILYDENVMLSDMDFFAAKNIYILNSSTGEGIVLRKSYRAAVSTMLSYIRFALRTWSRHEQVYREWHDRILELKSYEFWKKYLDI